MCDDGFPAGYDVIGDVHGCFDQLVALLEGLGYSDDSGTYRHRERQAIFVGDLIDRGPGQVEVLALVKAMTDAGTAQMVMGNHEFNAIAYATADPDCAGEHLRSHTAKNNRQHAEFLAQIGAGSADHRAAIDWFATLPLWLDLGGLRVVHACWDGAAIAGLESPHLDHDRLLAASTEGTESFEWVEHLCKGPEVELPEGHLFHDKDGNPRVKARFRWWDRRSTTYAVGCETPPDHAPPLPDTPIVDPPVEPYSDDIPVIFGHFWHRWPEIEMTDTTACVDYSAVRGGPLVAYRWSGEPTLTADHFVPAGADPRANTSAPE